MIDENKPRGIQLNGKGGTRGKYYLNFPGKILVMIPTVANGRLPTIAPTTAPAPTSVFFHMRTSTRVNFRPELREKYAKAQRVRSESAVGIKPPLSILTFKVGCSVPLDSRRIQIDDSDLVVRDCAGQPAEYAKRRKDVMLNYRACLVDIVQPLMLWKNLKELSMKPRDHSAQASQTL